MANVHILLLTTVLLCANSKDNLIPKLRTRIYGGGPTTIEEYPYQVSIMYIDSHICGGSLIHTQFVLSAAHCFHDFLPEYLLVRAGSTYIDQSGHVEQVTDVYQHPKFDKNTLLDNDICILKVANPFELNNTIQLVLLPLQDDPVDTNKIGVITGWGKLSDDFIPLELQQLDVNIIDSDVCKISYKNMITKRMFCAGYLEGYKDACKGDSGGALVVEGTVIGIISWGMNCASPLNPGVYTKVSYFINYINSVIHEKK